MINLREKKKKCVSVHDLMKKKENHCFVAVVKNRKQRLFCCAHTNSQKGEVGLIDKKKEKHVKKKRKEMLC